MEVQSNFVNSEIEAKLQFRSIASKWDKCLELLGKYTTQWYSFFVVTSGTSSVSIWVGFKKQGPCIEFFALNTEKIKESPQLGNFIQFN